MEKNENGGRGQRACAACKHQRKSCGPNCVFRQNFPAEKEREFASVQKIFGIANLKRMLNSVGTQEEKDEVAESIYWEAKAWADDPIHGPYGQIKRLEQQLEDQMQHSNTHHAPQVVVTEDDRQYEPRVVVTEDDRQYEPQVMESNGTPAMEPGKYSNGAISPVLVPYTSIQPRPETDGGLMPNSYLSAMGGSEIGQSETLSLGDCAQRNYRNQAISFINNFQGFKAKHSHPSGIRNRQWSGRQQANGRSSQVYASCYTLPTSGTNFNVNNSGNLHGTEIHQLNSMNPQTTSTTFPDQFRAGNYFYRT